MLKNFYIRLRLNCQSAYKDEHLAKLLSEFSTTELDSAWQNMRAFQFSADEKIRANFFQHMLEETYHAAIFKNAARELSKSPVPLLANTRVELYDGNICPKDALSAFIAYEAIGESDAYEQFSIYAKYIEPPALKKLFSRIAADELGHRAHIRSQFRKINQTWLLRLHWTINIRWLRLTNFFKRLLSYLLLNCFLAILSCIYYFAGIFLQVNSVSKKCR